MKTIGDRISYKKHENYTTLIISSKVDKWKENSILVWLIGWLVVGVATVYAIITQDFDRQEKLFYSILFVFWIYFFVRIGKAYLWRKKGMEFIKVDGDNVSIKSSILSYGKAVNYRLTDVKKLSVLEVDAKSFKYIMNDSFWVIGQGMLSFEYQGKNITFGKQLDKSDANKLHKAFKKILNEYRRN